MPKFLKNADFDNKGPFFVGLQELPLSCPRAGVALWNAHPRVYLPIEKTGKALCPYCSAEYILKDFNANFIDESDDITK